MKKPKKRAKTRLKIDVITLFPEMFVGPFLYSLVGNAQERGLLEINTHNLRRYVEEGQRVDDKPYGGGPGMVIRAEPVYKALCSAGRGFVVYFSPQGKKLTQSTAAQLARHRHLILLCGRYEGIDERILKFVDEQISIGDFVLSGGEIPAMALVETVARLIPGVAGNPESVKQDSFAQYETGQRLLDWPHYTRPGIWRGLRAPKVLLSGEHERIAKWRLKQAREITIKKRPDLLQ